MLFIAGQSAISLPVRAASATIHNSNERIHAIEQDQARGKKIYQAFCASCHDPNPLIELGAPKRGAPKDWQARLKQPANDLFKHVEEGLNAMPARGGCFECSDDALKEATTYLIKFAKKKH